MLGHAVWRSLVLVALGIFLRSVGRPQTYFTFEDTLTQIGLGYTFLFLLGFHGRRGPGGRPAGDPGRLLGGLCPLPAAGAGLRLPAVGVPADWPHHFAGFAAHWNKNSNLAWAFDRWFLNLFPRERPFAYNGGGYATLSFIPTLGTMILGLIAGGWLRATEAGLGQAARLVVAGAGLPGPGLAARLVGDLPERQADLDAGLDALQRRLVLPAPGGVLRE